MEFRWTEKAASDLERIADYLFEHVPEKAEEIIHVLYSVPDSLLSFPFRGRPGRKSGTRELVLTPLPYVVIYRITGDVVQLLRILHGAQHWP